MYNNLAKEIIIPRNINTMRIIFLYVGQGESTLMVIPDENDFKYLLIDTNIDKTNGGINNEKLLSDLLDKELDVFINTHPHKDHLRGIKNISENSVGIKEIWHSGHKPSKKHDEAFNELLDVIEVIGKENEYILFGTNNFNTIRKSDKTTPIRNKIGELDYIVLAPAEFVAEDIQDEDPEE